jgi:hypothetical protein
MSDHEPEILTEYKALRDEVLYHLGSQRQVVLTALVVSGTFLGLGIREHLDILLLIVPVFVFFAAISWSHSAACVSSIGGYIRDKVEPALPGVNWEHYLQERQSTKRGFKVGWLENVHVLGVFVLIDVLSLVVASDQYKFMPMPLAPLGVR